MKRYFILLVFVVVSCSSPTSFSESSLSEHLITPNNQEVVFKDVLQKHKGKVILLDFWASWCKDCIVSMPALKALQKRNPDITYVFISLDKEAIRWKKAVKNYQIAGDHYFMPAGKKGPMDDFLNLWWVPRYMVINEQGDITLFKAKKITDKKIEEALKKK